MFSFFRRRPSLPLDQVLSLYLLHAPDLSYSRKRTYGLSIRQWRRFGGPDDARAITTQSFVAVRNAASRSGLRPVTVEHMISAIGVLLRHCGPKSAACPHGLGLLNELPYRGRKLALVTEVRPAASLESLGEFYASAGLCQFAPIDQRVDWWRCFLVLAYNTGLRFSDLLMLRWDEVSEPERVIIRRANKTGKTHALPINAALAAHLALMPRQNETVLSSGPGQRDYIRKQLRLTCEAIGMARFTPQAIRRRTASEFERVHPGAGPLLLGHTLPGGTAISWANYIGALEIVLRPASEKIPQPWPVAP